MSVINKVLNDLEKRGANVGEITGVTRAYREPPAWRRMLPLLLFLAVLGGLGAALWSFLHPSAVNDSIPVARTMQPAKPAGAEQQAAAPQTASSSPVAAASAVAEAQDGGASELQLSFELATIPMPTVREKKAGVVPAKPARRAPGPEIAAPARPESALPSAGEHRALKRVTPQQQAQDEFNQALGLIQQGRKTEALSHLEATLRLDPAHEQGRKAMAGLLLDDKRNADAERILKDGLDLDPRNTGFAKLLARLQVERGALPEALQTLEKALPYAAQQPDYHAFLAAVLQRLNRHEEAIAHYQTALRESPSAGVWLMGLGISLQALKRTSEAREAFQRAIESRSLSAELQEFVERRVREL
jgi:MSHA biogenesis protein MshN